MVEVGYKRARQVVDGTSEEGEDARMLVKVRLAMGSNLAAQMVEPEVLAEEAQIAVGAW